MARENPQLLAFNRGIVSRYALGRVDLTKMRYAASKMVNWMPRVLGPMMLRPGLGYITTTQGNAVAKPVPFIRSTTDTAILEFTNDSMAVLVGEAPITRPSVSAAITNGTFGSDITSWTTGDTEAGAAVAWASPGYMRFTSNGTALAAAYQSVSVGGGQTATEHALRIVVHRGPLFVKVGTSAGLDDIVPVQQLNAGTYSLAFVPNNATFVVYFYTRGNRICDLDSVAIEGAGVMTLPTPWATADLPNLRWDQSADVVYMGDGAVQQRQIERHATRSWGIALYAPEDGPFRAINTTGITITASALSGDVSLTASGALFKSTHVGALFKLSSQGQFVKVIATAENEWSGAVRVTGVGTGRHFVWAVTGTYSGTVTVQSSATGPSGPWASFDSTTGTGSHNGADGMDNQIIWYRIGIATGDYTSGTATGTISYSGGSLDGVVRITSVSTGISAGAMVIGSLGNTTATGFWYEGSWSDFRGWPTAPALYEDRLWWFNDIWYGSVVDAFGSFDATITGDSGPIQRTIGSGPTDVIAWSMPMLRLLIGTSGAEVSARSSSLDEPLTPTNFNLKFPSRQGSANVKSVIVDDHGYFVQRSGARIYGVDFDSSNYIKLDYIATDLTAFVPEIGLPSDDAPSVDRSFVNLVVQRQPNTRVHGIRADGTVAVCVLDKVEQVECWTEVDMSRAGGGFVEDAVVLPGALEDAVYYLVRRSVNGGTVRYYEKWAQEQECKGATLNKQADSFVIYSGAPANVLTNIAPHLAGLDAIVWADGIDLSPAPAVTDPATGYISRSPKSYPVGASGTITLDDGVTVSNAVIGLAYVGEFEGVKLAYGAQLGSALTKRKRVISVGMILADTHSQGIQYGQDANHLDDMPRIEDGELISYDKVWSEYDKDSFSFNGSWDTDSRVYLQAFAPRPCKVMALVVNLDTKEGT